MIPITVTVSTNGSHCYNGLTISQLRYFYKNGSHCYNGLTISQLLDFHKETPDHQTDNLSLLCDATKRVQEITESVIQGKDVIPHGAILRLTDDNRLFITGNLLTNYGGTTLGPSVHTLSGDAPRPNFSQAIIMSEGPDGETLYNGRTLETYKNLLCEFKIKKKPYAKPPWGEIDNDLVLLCSLVEQREFYVKQVTTINKLTWNDWDEELHFKDMNLTKILEKLEKSSSCDEDDEVYRQ